MNQTFVKSVTEQLPQLGLLQDEPMKKHTTFRIGGPADYYAEPDMSQISKLIEMAKACDMPVTVIGNGSNLLVGDKGIRGLVIGIGKGLSEIEVTEAVAQQSTRQLSYHHSRRRGYPCSSGGKGSGGIAFRS